MEPLIAENERSRERKIKEITISHGLPDSNLGGAALGISLAQVLQKSFPTCQINYISSHVSPELIEKAHPYMKQDCPTVNILPSLVAGRIEHQDIKSNFLRKSRGILWAIGFLFSFVYLLVPGLLKSETANRIRESDVVISRGTNIFYDKKGAFFRSLLAICWLLYPLVFSWRVGTPFAIYAQSFGPVRNRLSRLLMKIVFSKAVVIMPREERSQHFLAKKLELANDLVELVPDSVFSMKSIPEHTIRDHLRKSGLPFRQYLAVTVRTGMYGDESHLSKIAEVIDHLLDQNKISCCVIVVQCPRFQGYSMFECDEDISVRLSEMLRNKERIVVVHQPEGPTELLKIYGGAKVTLGMRLHSVIFSLVAGTPALAISYWGPKTIGVMEMAGLSDYCINIDRMSVIDVEEKVLLLIDNNESERRIIESRVEDLRQQSRNAPHTIFSRIS